MQQLTASPATHPPASAERVESHGRHPQPSKTWALLEALAYAGAFIDPTGVLVLERLRRAREEQA
jgi:hypothetical protein